MLAKRLQAIVLAGLTFCLGTFLADFAGVKGYSTALRHQMILQVESLNAATISRDRTKIESMIAPSVNIKSGTDEWVLTTEELSTRLLDANVRLISVTDYAEEQEGSEPCISFHQKVLMVHDGVDVSHQSKYVYCFARFNDQLKLIRVVRSN